MPYTNKYLAKLAERARTKEPIALAAYQQYKQGLVEQADKTITRFTRTLRFRSLTMREAGLMYRATIIGAVVSPSDLGSIAAVKNAKRGSISYYTCHHDKCPCCGIPMHSNSSTWFIKPYFLAYGHVRVCRRCNAAYKHSDRCMPVYYTEFWLVHAALGNDVAWEVFKPYLQLGMVYDSTSEKQTAQASEYMQHCIGGAMQ